MRESSSSRDTVLRTLKLRGRASVDDVAAAVKISKNAARVQLLKLESEGAVQRVTPTHDGPGRPPLCFALTPLGHHRFPNDDSRMLTDLLGYLADHGQVELTRAFFEQVWARRRIEFEQRVAPNAPLAERLRALRGLLDDGGFMPQIRQRKHKAGGRHLRVRACHCPFPGAVAATRLPCQREREFLAAAVGTPPTSVRLATLDEAGCDFDFELLE